MVWTIEQMEEETQLDRESLLQILKTLLEHEVLICTDDLNPGINSTLLLNEDFQSDQTRVDLRLKVASLNPSI